MGLDTPAACAAPLSPAPCTNRPPPPHLTRIRLTNPPPPKKNKQYGGVLSAITGAMSPHGPGCSDHNGRERAANLLTSLPYAWVGLRGLRARAAPEGRAWSASLLGVAAGSLAFHASSGRWRCVGRRVDYWMISASSALLTRAIYPRQPASVTLASLLATPFRPFAVSALHTAAMEARFLRRALAEPALRPAQRAHSAAALAGMALFFLEDARPHVPMVHPAWHLCSAAATNAVHALLADCEAPGGVASAAAAAAAAEAAKPVLLPAHERAAGTASAASAALEAPAVAAVAAAALAAAVSSSAAAATRELAVAPLSLTA